MFNSYPLPIQNKQIFVETISNQFYFFFRLPDIFNSHMRDINFERIKRVFTIWSPVWWVYVSKFPLKFCQSNKNIKFSCFLWFFVCIENVRFFFYFCVVKTNLNWTRQHFLPRKYLFMRSFQIYLKCQSKRYVHI